MLFIGCQLFFGFFKKNAWFFLSSTCPESVMMPSENRQILFVIVFLVDLGSCFVFTDIGGMDKKMVVFPDIGDAFSQIQMLKYPIQRAVDIKV